MEKKRICIVTNYRGTANYGAILQAYALNAYIRSCGCDCQTLNYCAPRKNKKKMIQEYMKQPNVLAALVWGKIRKQLSIHTYQKRSAVFDHFRDKYIPHTRECRKENAVDVVKDFDVLVCGSDQIWRPGLQTGELDDVMWMKDFPHNIPKFSYAASLGITELKEGMISYIREALSDFRAVSVREESAKKILEKICGREIQVVLDPVFLLNSNQWQAFADCKTQKQKYIFCYFIEPKRKIYQRIEEFAKTVQMEIIYMPYMGYQFNWPDFKLHGKKETAATPQEFIGYIASAEYVFTDSFHATAFSIMLRKNLHVFITNHGTRLQNLLTLTGLEGRIEKGAPIQDGKVPDEQWDVAEQRLEMERKHSKMFLEQIIT